MKTGRPIEVNGARYEDGEALIWPGSAGLHNWPPMSYSPNTGLVYIPAHEMAAYYNDKGRDPKTWTMTPDYVMGLSGFFDDQSEKRRGGTVCVSSCRYWWQAEK